MDEAVESEREQYEPDEESSAENGFAGDGGHGELLEEPPSGAPRIGRRTFDEPARGRPRGASLRFEKRTSAGQPEPVMIRDVYDHGR